MPWQSKSHLNFKGIFWLNSELTFNNFPQPSCGEKMSILCLPEKI